MIIELNARQFYIYTLSDPRTMEVRYVGWAYNVSKRYRAHLNDYRKAKTKKNSWIQSLIENEPELLPVPDIIDKGSGKEHCREREQFWIKYYKDKGCDLVNGTIGGDGLIGASLETRQKMSKAKIGIKHTPEQITRRTSKTKGLKRSPETCAKIAAAKTGLTYSAETKLKQSLAKKGKKHPIGCPCCIKRSQLTKGKKLSEQAKFKKYVSTYLNKLRRYYPNFVYWMLHAYFR